MVLFRIPRLEEHRSVRRDASPVCWVMETNTCEEDGTMRHKFQRLGDGRQAILGETKRAVTSFGGLAVLVEFWRELGLLEAVPALQPALPVANRRPAEPNLSPPSHAAHRGLPVRRNRQHRRTHSRAQPEPGLGRSRTTHTHDPKRRPLLPCNSAAIAKNKPILPASGSCFSLR